MQYSPNALVLLLQVKDHITKLAKKGKTPSEIGVFLRDQHGIAQVRAWLQRGGWPSGGAACRLRSLSAEERAMSIQEHAVSRRSRW